MDIQQFYHLFLQAKDITIDNRTIKPGDLFFAFSGDNFNAATKAEQAIEQGAIAVIVEQKEFENIEKNIFFVPSTLLFLQDLARFHRNNLSIPIIGLTGSNGKTTTKELIHAVLSQKYKVQYTKGNLNNHIGVPLTVLSINAEHEIAVIEMGANHQKEIEFLCTIAQPTIGYITNFGKAHLEGFGGVEGVIKGKSELYDYLKTNHKKILFNNKDEIQVGKIKNYFNTISFGDQSSDYQFQLVTSENYVGIECQGQQAISQLTGNYNFTNICAATSLGLYFQIEFDSIRKAIEEYTPTNMRSQIVKKGNRTLVLDTYNANPSSMKEALLNFKNFKGTKTAILGDMLELGVESHTEHDAILDFALQLGFDEIITVGPEFKICKKNKNSFDNALQLSTYLENNHIHSENILIKGSRGIALEKIIDKI